MITSKKLEIAKKYIRELENDILELISLDIEEEKERLIDLHNKSIKYQIEDPCCDAFEIIKYNKYGDGLPPKEEGAVFFLLVGWGASERFRKWKGVFIEDLSQLQDSVFDTFKSQEEFDSKDALIEHLQATYHSELVEREHFN